MAPQPPRQWKTEAAPFELGEFRLTPRAEYKATAKLLSKRRYRRGRMTPLSPWDFALGWGPMSNEALLRHLSLTQGDRFLFRHALLPQLPMEKIDQLSANVHMIPATDAITEALDRMPGGAILEVSGKLVDVDDLRAATRTPTSLTRTDTGAGACEILYVESVKQVSPVVAAAG